MSHGRHSQAETIYRQAVHAALADEAALVAQVREIETQVDAGTTAVASEQLAALRRRLHNVFGALRTADDAVAALGP
jgi:hypothetical protein